MRRRIALFAAAAVILAALIGVGALRTPEVQASEIALRGGGDLVSVYDNPPECPIFHWNCAGGEADDACAQLSVRCCFCEWSNGQLACLDFGAPTHGGICMIGP